MRVGVAGSRATATDRRVEAATAERETWREGCPQAAARRDEPRSGEAGGRKPGAGAGESWTLTSEALLRPRDPDFVEVWGGTGHLATSAALAESGGDWRVRNLANPSAISLLPKIEDHPARREGPQGLRHETGILGTASDENPCSLPARRDRLAV